MIGAGLAVAAAHDRDPRRVAGRRASWPTPSTASPPLTAGDDIPRNGRIGTSALAGGSALFGAWLARAVD